MYKGENIMENKEEMKHVLGTQYLETLDLQLKSLNSVIDNYLNANESYLDGNPVETNAMILKAANERARFLLNKATALSVVHQILSDIMYALEESRDDESKSFKYRDGYVIDGVDPLEVSRWFIYYKDKLLKTLDVNEEDYYEY